MRWKYVMYGDYRIWTGFAWFPIRIYPQREGRWLEKVCVLQVFKYDKGDTLDKGNWLSVRFLDTPQDIEEARKLCVEKLCVE
jgi:hypothetical protein